MPDEQRLSIYLAGPEVFLPDAVEIGKKKATCHRYGFTGKFPLDNEIDLPAKQPRAQGLATN